jgi:hypothetical protein
MTGFMSSASRHRVSLGRPGACRTTEFPREVGRQFGRNMHHRLIHAICYFYCTAASALALASARAVL